MNGSSKCENGNNSPRNMFRMSTEYSLSVEILDESVRAMFSNQIRNGVENLLEYKCEVILSGSISPRLTNNEMHNSFILCMYVLL